MKVSEAKELIRNVSFDATKPTTWADLGCGHGVFTYALAELLAQNSIIYGIDRITEINKVRSVNNVEIKFMQADFVMDEIQLPKLNGLMMANSLHYVKEKKALLVKLVQYLSNTGIFIIIEYDTLKANKWVPYPVNQEQLNQLFASIGFAEFNMIAEKPSVYGDHMMYCCVIRKQ